MKIKNEEVKLKIGEKQYVFHNLILDSYIKKFIDSQLLTNYESLYGLKYTKSLKYILLKLDNPISFDEKSVLQNKDFDIALLFDSFEPKQIASSNKIIVEYFYNSNKEISVLDYSDNKTKKLRDFDDRKITAIAFNTYWRPDLPDMIPVCSVIDTSNYNLFLMKDQKLTMSRKDIFETDGIFKSDLKAVKFPLHLSVKGLEGKANEFVADEHSNGYGILKSIGLSTNEYYKIEKEFDINKIGYSINKNTIEFNEIDNYLSIEKLLPSNELFPFSNLYPLASQYEYVVFKYAVVQSDIVDNLRYPVERGYYYIVYPVSKYGKSKVKLKYERS